MPATIITSENAFRYICYLPFALFVRSGENQIGLFQSVPLPGSLSPWPALPALGCKCSGRGAGMLKSQQKPVFGGIYKNNHYHPTMAVDGKVWTQINLIWGPGRGWLVSVADAPYQQVLEHRLRLLNGC
ncbi:hypothetical protein KIL84_001237 [Mauremys mutica]|uniref:Uncharacterized protein n=1 Tax=Mauremys mutica TaxID=74926 RepID=A0A9D3X024_9SAUR|nr:hypothetical protein KIL84_001237 [Mauremys mutica]